MLSCIMAVMLGLFMGTGMSVMDVWAASGNVYTCAIHPCYAHPVTGVIEDSGGQESYATGQGMVEGCIGSTGLMERTDSGEYYVTIRMGLMDFTANQSFQVQEAGASGWAVPEMGVTATGTDKNGTTADVCIKVPSENFVIRGNMYVTPMGRDVIFFLYASDYVAGNTTDMKPAIVTEGPAAQEAAGEQSSVAVQNEDSGSSETVVIAPDIYAELPRPDELAGVGDTGSGAAGNVSGTSEVAVSSGTGGNSGQAPVLQSTITQAAVPQADVESTGGNLGSTRGLSLSTEDAAARVAYDDGAGNGLNTADGSGAASDAGSQIMVLTTSITIAGLLLLSATALVVYYFRKNWRKWGGYDEED